MSLDDEVAFEEDFRYRVVESADSLSAAARAARSVEGIAYLENEWLI
ncbi:MAG: hypothetical protein AAF171_22820 [Cyanobacteria bacterium P01_A01_bin.116]